MKQQLINIIKHMDSTIKECHYMTPSEIRSELEFAEVELKRLDNEAMEAHELGTSDELLQAKEIEKLLEIAQKLLYMLTDASDIADPRGSVLYDG